MYRCSGLEGGLRSLLRETDRLQNEREVCVAVATTAAEDFMRGKDDKTTRDEEELQ